VIKTFSGSEKERRRYEVRISIITPKRIFSYSEEGWELPNVFDHQPAQLRSTLGLQFLFHLFMAQVNSNSLQR
jgi:hypothetical protein